MNDDVNSLTDKANVIDTINDRINILDAAITFITAEKADDKDVLLTVMRLR